MEMILFLGGRVRRGERKGKEILMMKVKLKRRLILMLLVKMLRR